ncbi:phosphodiester glycosidase family protein [Sporosarcina sp. NPDC096371]|uniref:phosphodiester glycosidase family protein n=1 Tax=Sporosarcina sp. NPDC096371 TaxID=3364530 RepID=UPI00382F6AFF
MLKKKVLLVTLAMLLVFQVGVVGVSAGNVSQGVYHSNENINVGGRNQTVNQLSINLNQPYTTIEVGGSSLVNKLSTVSSLAKLHTQDKHHVVGAINASFFHFSNGYPSYLLIKDKKIQHLGAVSTNYNDFMHTPAAFGVTSDNTAKIGRYNLAIQIEHAGNSFQLTSLNRERNNNESILYTSSWPYDRTRTNNTGLEIVVETPRSAEQNISLGEKVTGTVTGIRPYGQATSAAIPKNSRGFVISSQGTEAEKLRNIKIGDSISASFDVDEEWKDANFMLATGPLLVQNGKVAMSIDPNSSRAKERTARTAVATDATGKRAFFVTVDSGVKGVSSGMTLNEFANHLVKIGAHNALNLDGGGSTTMVTRKYGDIYPTLANRPSAGRERSVNAILEAISTAPYSDPTYITASQTEQGTVAIGASVGFKVNSALDQYYNVLTIDQSKLKLESVTNGVGVIENNKFVGQKAGSGVVNALYGNTPITIPVSVTDKIDDIVITPAAIQIGTGETISVNAKGVLKNAQVIFNPDAVQLSVSPNVGTIEGKTFVAGNTEATGTLTATFGSMKKTVPVTVSDKPVVVGSFESITGLEATTARAQASIGLETKIQPIDQKGSVRLNYDFTANKENVSAAYLTWTNGFKLASQPKKLGVWVYGDGKNHWLRGSLTDGNGKDVVVDFTKENGLNWTGWKYVEAVIPPNTVAPLTLNRLYVAEQTPAKKDKGFLLFDKLQVFYSDKPYVEKAFAPSSTARQVETNKKFTVKLTQPMKTEFFTDRYIYVEDVNGVRQPVTVSKTTDARTLEVSASVSGYTSGSSYRLVVTHFVQSNKGVPMVKDHITEFKVK